MLDLKNKYSPNLNTKTSNYTIKSLLQPEIGNINLAKHQIVWYRQPPSPYDSEQLSFNLNKLSYKCSSLDFECYIVCKVVGQEGEAILRFDYGPIESYLFNRSSPINEFRVNLLLFGQYKKCTFSCIPTPTLSNLNNNSKYILTQQDIKSIYLLNQQQETTDNCQLQSLNQQQRRLSSSSVKDNTTFITSKPRKTLVIGNLFQRFILLKLFNEIPTGMYCHSIELLEIIFYDEMSCNMALMALNRFKYPKKQQNKPISNILQQSAVTKILMKKSNESMTNINSINHSKSSPDQSFHLSAKKEFLPLSMLKSIKKSPKQSINSQHQSLASKNSNKLVQSKIRPSQNQHKLNSSLIQNESKVTIYSPESNYQLPIKHPKVSIQSTQINSTKAKQPRQKMASFPQTLLTQNLKSSQLIIKPNEFKSCFILRRSQEQIKTPRMDVDEDVNIFSAKESAERKSVFLPQSSYQIQEECKYVNQFENLLFQTDRTQIKEEELCLNDSFAKLEAEEQKQKEKAKQNQSVKKIELRLQIDKVQSVNQTVPTLTTGLIFQRLPSNINSLRETLQTVLHENSQLKRKNEALKKEIDEMNIMEEKKDEIVKYQDQIQKMKEIRKSLIQQIQRLKVSACSVKNQFSQNNAQQADKTSTSERIEKQDIFSSPQEETIMKNEGVAIISERSGERRKTNLIEYKGVIFPQRQSEKGNEQVYKFQQRQSPTFGPRRSQEQSCPSFILRQCETQPVKKSSGIMNSGKYFKLQSEQSYFKMRNNQSYSFKTRQIMKYDQKRQ